MLQFLNESTYGGSSFGLSQDQAAMGQLYDLNDADIMKALATSGSVGTDASAMVGESLDPVVHEIVLNSDNFAPMLRRFYAYDAKSHIEEYNQITSRGLAENSWRKEGLLGAVDASTWARNTVNVRFMGQVGAVTRTAQSAAKAKFGDLKALEAYSRLNSVLLNGEKNIFWADSTIQPLAFQGILQQAPTDSTRKINKATTGNAGSRTTYTAGGTLLMTDSRNAAETPLQYGLQHTALYCAPSEKVGISEAQDTNMRWYKEKQQSKIAPGMIVDTIDNDFGPIEIMWSIFLKNELGRMSATAANPAGSFHANAPLILDTAPTGAAAAGGNLPNDDYYYGVAQFNEVSEGPIKLQSTGYTADNTNGTINVTVTHNSSTTNVSGYRLYRSTTSGSDYSKMRLVKEVALNTAASTQVIADDGSFIPGSRRAVQLCEKAISLGQLLAPTMRDLADIDNTHRFSIDWELGVLLYDGANAVTSWYNIGGSVADPS